MSLRTRLKLISGQRGTKKLQRLYGERGLWLLPLSAVRRLGFESRIEREKVQ